MDENNDLVMREKRAKGERGDLVEEVAGDDTVGEGEEEGRRRREERLITK